jgi:hypothetical protein
MATRLQLRIIGAFILGLMILIGPMKGPAQSISLAVTTDNESLQPASDLLAAELSHQEGIALLERAKVELVLREQRLSLGGLSSKECLNLGQLLGADGLLVLGEEDGQQPPRVYLRLVAVKTGVILQEGEYPWPLPDPTEWSKQVWLEFRSLIPKL